MKILMLGGTGAIGTSTKDYLLKLGFEVHITSRSPHVSDEVIYHQGDAHDIEFLSKLLVNSYDAIVDFMQYSTIEFNERIRLLLDNTSQYVFMSSARVYAPYDGLINENCPRILEVCDDPYYLSTDDYALAKARQEDIILSFGKANYTIVRPSITYNTNRLQYAIGEKEEWLFRALNGEKVIFPKCLENTITTMSYGKDVGYALSLLVCNKKAYGVIVNIAGGKPIPWGKVNDIYSRTLKEIEGKELLFEYIENWEHLGKKLGKYYQLKYARSINRRFDNSTLMNLVGNIEFVSPEQGLAQCLKEFLISSREFDRISPRFESYYNRITGDTFVCKSFSSVDKVKYCIGRYTRYF